MFPTNLTIPGAASSLTNWMSLPDVQISRLTAVTAGKPFATLKSSYDI